MAIKRENMRKAALKERSTEIEGLNIQPTPIPLEYDSQLVLADKRLKNLQKSSKYRARTKGRPRMHDEVYAKEVAVNALVKKFGTLERSMQVLLESGEPTLVKFVYEHAYGKPRERIDVTTQGDKVTAIAVEVIVKKIDT